ncbi:MAG: hypothetical protein M1816_006074 [Peltula sp. TS41687]|nr:MAG: hypothetical protein M1816_006074 [Peltula sp. TS41687]
MLPDGEDEIVFKKWIVKRLEDISDADSDVLADYVLALLRHDSPEAEVRTLCIEQLEDFLKDHTAKFVDDVLSALRSKSYLPGVQSAPPASFDALDPSIRDSHAHPSSRSLDISGRGQPLRRKRSYNDRDPSPPKDGRDYAYGRGAGGERAFKQPRRGGPRNGRFDAPGGRPNRLGMTTAGPGQDTSMPTLPGMAQSPTVPFPGLPPTPTGLPFDPTDPMAALMAMQAMTALGLPPPLPLLPPGLPPFPQVPSPIGFAQQSNASLLADGKSTEKSSERCKDYDEKGFCALGGTCPYDHGADHIVVPEQGEEYDPTNSSILTDVHRPQSNAANGHSPPHHQNVGGDRGRGRGRGRGGPGIFVPGRRGRAEFSQQGPNHDRSVTTVVVENIPEENFEEQAVREFFSIFGNIQEVQMQAYKRLALVKYDSWASAKKAYESPRVIFDNRFVKVYWYKPDSVQSPRPGANGAAKAGSPTSAHSPSRDTQINLDEMKRKQDELQKAHEEKMKKIKETEDSKRVLEKRKEELLKSQAEEKRKLMERLAAKTGRDTLPLSASSPGLPGSDSEKHAAAGNGTSERKSSTQTEALKAQLAALEAEAQSLGIDASAPDDPYASTGRGRGRGAYRGRGGYMPRGRGGFDPSRGGGYRGRGSTPYAWAGGRGGGANKLDNRTKRVAVSGVEFDEGKDEALRQYLLGVGEFENIELNPGRKDSQIITFKDRFTAEKFIYGSPEIPSVGKVELSWVNNNPGPSSTPTTATITASTSNKAPITPVTPSLTTPATGVTKPTTVEKGSRAPAPAPAHKPSQEHNGEHESKTRQGHGQQQTANAGHPNNEDYDVADDDDDRWMVE